MRRRVRAVRERRRRRPFPGRLLIYGERWVGVRIGALSSPNGLAYFIDKPHECVAPLVERELLKLDGWVVEVYGADRIIVYIPTRPPPPEEGGEAEWPAWS